MAVNCSAFNSFLFRRVPDFDKELAKDRFPVNYTYSGLYQTKTWPSFTGYQHTWDKVHVTVPNDDGNWDVMNSDDCMQSICDPSRVFMGWGSTRNTYIKYHRDYQTPVFCYDQLRHVEEAVAQVAAIIEGLKKVPDNIVSDFIRRQSLLTCDNLYICGAGLIVIANSGATLFPTTTQINLGSTANLPTSKITMPYLQHYAPQLLYKGYHDKEFVPEAKFLMMGDIQGILDLCNANPALSAMYSGADFAKGGKFYQFGAMMGCGNFLMKVDSTPLRYQHMGSGLLQQVFPYQNVATTVGKEPLFDPQYEAAPYQIYHVYARAARDIYVGDTASVNKEMPFLSRNLMGKWSWKSPDFFKAVDPNTGTVCSYQNDKKNKGYMLGEYELGVKTIYPEIELLILAQREAAAVADLPRAAALPNANTLYQSLLPYNTPWCTM